MKMKKRFFIILLPFILVISGCAEMNSNFDCPMRSGIRCESLDQVNARVDRGEIGGENWSTAKLNVKSGPVLISPIKGLHSNATPPIRFKETTMRIWIAPFEDTSGNYHEESEIYTVIKPGYWIGNPPKVMQIEEITHAK